MLAVTIYSLENSSSIFEWIVIVYFQGQGSELDKCIWYNFFIILSKETDYVFLSQPIWSETQIYINVREEVS